MNPKKSYNKLEIKETYTNADNSLMIYSQLVLLNNKLKMSCFSTSKLLTQVTDKKYWSYRMKLKIIFQSKRKLILIICRVFGRTLIKISKECRKILHWNRFFKKVWEKSFKNKESSCNKRLVDLKASLNYISNIQMLNQEINHTQILSSLKRLKMEQIRAIYRLIAMICSF